MTPRKRVYDLVLAFAELIETMPELDLKLSIAGKIEGEYPEYIRNLIKRLHLQERITLEGRVDDIVNWYNNIDIIVSHSAHESAHMTLHEGKSCGCFPISHHWDGVEEFLEKDQIYFTNTEFRECVSNFYSISESRRAKRRKKMREQIIKSNSLPVIVKKFDEVLQCVT